MKLLGILLCCALAIASLAQTAPKPVYAESFRRGATKITESSFPVNLNTKTPSYRIGVKDASGKDRFVFSLSPIRVGEEDGRILAWQASLEDIHTRTYGNLLLPSRDPYLNESTAGKVSRLDSNPYALVPIEAKRVFKVQDFYCILQVTAYHRISPDRLHLDSMAVDVQFSNTNPLTAGEN
jgi:hypothetical protein